MPEYTEETPPLEVGGSKIPTTDSLAELVQDYFLQAKEYRQEDEETWRGAYDAYRALHPERVDRVLSLAKKNGIFIHLVRRRVNSARVKITSLLFESGKIPFTISPNYNPKFAAPDLQQLPPGEVVEEVKTRAERMENIIRDILRKTDYIGVIGDTVLEMCLYGTGITKSIVLKNYNYPVYRTARQDPEILKAEDLLESEMIPMIERVSLWDIFPNPEAKSIDDCDWVIQRAFYSAQQLRNLSQQNGFIEKAIEEVLERGLGIDEGADQSESPSRYNKHRGDRIKKYQVLEMWGDIPAEDLEPYMDVSKKMKGTNISVCITSCGDKVLRVVTNPFDGRIPFDFCYWERNTESVWGDGIFFSIRDLQDITNFAFAQMVEGKALASNPMSVVDPQAFDEGEDIENIYPGKVIKVRPGNDVQSAYRSVIIPDVTGGLDRLIDLLERQADIASGQSAIGLGESAQYQTKTATGMSILQSNANKLTAEVVRSVSNMISRNIQAIYHWVMSDSEDSSLKGDYDCESTGFMQYVAKEVHNTQLLSLMQVLTQNPDLREYVDMGSFVKPVFRAFSLEPEGMVLTPEEKQQKDQATAEQMQQMQQAEIAAKQEIMRLQSLLQEKIAVSSDERKREINEREILMTQGNTLTNDVDFSDDSILIQEEVQQAQAQEIQQEMMGKEEDKQLKKTEENINKEQADVRKAGGGGQPQRGGPPQGGGPPQQGMSRAA